MFNVVKNDEFINQSYAQINGFFGVSMKGRHSPMKGKKHTIDSIQKGIETRRKNGTLVCSNETKEKIGKWISEELGIKFQERSFLQFTLKNVTK
ncbi:MAG: NUMOD3 domain-containing DNA-binding protein [Candidatus Nitrosotenuis sp.]